MNCLICGRQSFQAVASRVRDSRSHRIVRCRSCDLVQITPIPSPDEDAAFHDTNRQSKNVKFPTNIRAIGKKLSYDTNRRADFIGELLPPRATLLDVGSGYGFFLEAMRKKGFRVTGLEVSSERRAQSRRVTRVPLITTNLLTEKLEIPPVDAVTLFHVLEHIREPVLFLRQLKKALKPKGTLFVEVPNVDDAMIGANASYRDFYWQRAHLAYYSAKTLKNVLRRAGFSSPTVTFRQRYGLDNWMNWQVNGAPQLTFASHQTDGPYRWLEDEYKRRLEAVGTADTLMVQVRA